MSECVVQKYFNASKYNGIVKTSFSSAFTIADTEFANGDVPIETCFSSIVLRLNNTSPPTANTAFIETSPSTIKLDESDVVFVTSKVELNVVVFVTSKVELNMVASVTSNVDESVVPKSTCKVESIVVAPPIEKEVLNDASF